MKINKDKLLNGLMLYGGSVAAQIAMWYVYIKVVGPSWVTFAAPVLLVVLFVLMEKECHEKGTLSDCQLFLCAGLLPLLTGLLGFLIYSLTPALQAPDENSMFSVGFGFIEWCTKLVFSSVYITVTAGILWIKNKIS